MLYICLFILLFICVFMIFLLIFKKNYIIKYYDKEKYRKGIFAYNQHKYHYEMIGCILDFCNSNDIPITIMNEYHDIYWYNIYKYRYNFLYIKKKPTEKELKDFKLCIILTDENKNFFPSNINTIIIHHREIPRRPSKYINLYYIPIFTFRNKHNPQHLFPVHAYIDYETKLSLLNYNRFKKPIIAVIGDWLTNNNIKKFINSIINYKDFDFYFISRNLNIYKKNIPYNIYLKKNISATEMFNILSYSHYIGICIDPTHNHFNSKTMSGSMPLSFSLGCKLIIPSLMNKYMKLTSVISYNVGESFWLNPTPCLIDTFNERKILISNRDNYILKYLNKK